MRSCARWRWLPSPRPWEPPSDRSPPPRLSRRLRRPGACDRRPRRQPDGHRQGAGTGDMALARPELSLSGLVPRRQARPLVALGAAVGAGAGRLVWPLHVYAGPPDVRASPEDLWPPVGHGHEGSAASLEGGALGPGCADPALCARRREIFRRACLPSRQSRLLRQPLSRLELDARRPQAGRGRHLGEGGAQGGPAFRRVQSRRACLALVPDRLWL